MTIENEQAFVFEESDTTDLEHELNVVGEDEGHFHVSGQENIYHNEGDYSAMYQHVDGDVASLEMASGDNLHVAFTSDG